MNFISKYIELILFIICFIFMVLGITGLKIPDLKEMGTIN